jgi:hypothetical protein
VSIKFTTEYDKEEFIALLPHIQEMAKLYLPYFIETRDQFMNLWRDLGKGLTQSVIPDLLAILKSHSDSSLLDSEASRAIRLKEANVELRTEVRGF